MVYRGHIQNGIVVFDEPAPLPEGARVTVEPDSAAPHVEPPTQPTWGEVFKDVLGKAEGLPVDMARNHDHYLHGAPKK